MAQEERKCSSGSCGGGTGAGGSGGGRNSSRSSKKQKQKQPPQRGLGVAQLERMRLEEQQKKDPISFYPPLPNFRIENEFNPSSSFFRHIPPVPDVDVAALGPAPSLSMRNYVDYDAEKRSHVTDHEPLRPVPSLSMRNYVDYDAEKRSRVTDHELELRSKLNLPLGGQRFMQRIGSDHPPLLVNASTAASMSLSSYQLEPPSNQSHHHGSVAPFRPQGEKVPGVGAKRSYPFSVKNPPAPYFPFKILKVGNPITNRSEEPSFSGIDSLREGPSRSSSMLESSSTDSMKENQVSGGEFLTLAPPVDTSPLQNWSQSQHLASSALRSYNPYPGFEFPQYRGYQEGLVDRHAPGWTDQLPRRPSQQPYNFLPPTIPPNEDKNTHVNGSSKDTSGSVDLNLKL